MIFLLLGVRFVGTLLGVTTVWKVLGKSKMYVVVDVVCPAYVRAKNMPTLWFRGLKSLKEVEIEGCLVVVDHL